MTKSVTYRDIPEDVDIVDFLLGQTRFVVPKSRLTPELTVKLYQKALELVDVKTICHKSRSVTHGLQSLPQLLRYEPDIYGQKWLRLEAVQEYITPALPGGTPYQLQYLPLFPVHIPTWKEMQAVGIEKLQSWGGKKLVCGPLKSKALLQSKSNRLYYVEAVWYPKEDYYCSHDERHRESPFTFQLLDLNVEIVAWDDVRILEHVHSGDWADFAQLFAYIGFALSESAQHREFEAKHLRSCEKRLEKISIYPGR